MWYSKVLKDITLLPDAIEYYTDELGLAKLDARITGNIEKAAANMPGIVEHRFGQLQEIEAILEWLNVQLRKTKTRVFKKFLEGYNKVLSSRDADKYADGDSEVIEWQLLINEFAMVRNKYLGLMKAIDSKQFQINNIVKLRVAGMDDTVLG